MYLVAFIEQNLILFRDATILLYLPHKCRDFLVRVVLAIGANDQSFLGVIDAIGILDGESVDDEVSLGFAARYFLTGQKLVGAAERCALFHRHALE